MLHLERVWNPQNGTAVLVISGATLVLVALADWWTSPYLSFGFLYLFPIMLSAAFLPRSAIVLLGFACAVLAESFNSLERSYIRLCFETLALVGSGLFAAELARNRKITMASRDRLRALVETSPAAIVTVDQFGFVELANRAAIDLLMPRDGKLLGTPIAAFLPELPKALQWEEAPLFRASMQCRGHRGNGETFTAEVWFSSYKEGVTPKLAAIVVDMTEEISDAASHSATSDRAGPQARISLSARELEVLRSVVQGFANKQIAARLEISESSVKNALQQLFIKTGVRSRSQLVRVAIEQYRNLL